MNVQSLAQLEAHLERLIEGAFTLFSKAVRAQDIAMQLARAMEDGARAGEPGDPRPFAPDRYFIYLHPEAQAQLLQRQPDMAAKLAAHMVDLATDSGYRLTNDPVVQILADAGLAPGGIRVQAEHITRPRHATDIMKRIPLVEEAATQPTPGNAHMILNGQAIPLSEAVVNIGRSRDNHIVLDDPYVSRHHVQIRLRFGCYTLFDTNSQSGTYVNDIRVREHRLQAGDVIRLGNVRMLYMEDDPLGDSHTGANITQDS